eukprot:TRINITY_DN27490_c0_g1_i2.p1 TRINITY_DN27490_c0_g1~~TRINITY_DN27490_c0_g1_i2.p1  ORF type:complete len:489 (+),score=47.87 TRINITY_DN27490_c0_g1_i2:52-1518(+)
MGDASDDLQEAEARVKPAPQSLRKRSMLKAPVASHLSKRQPTDGAFTLMNGGSLLLSKKVWQIYRDIDATAKEKVLNQLQAIIGVLQRHCSEMPQESIGFLARAGQKLSDCRMSCMISANMGKEEEQQKYLSEAMDHYLESKRILDRNRPTAVAWHDLRRRWILEQHPEVKTLMGDDVLTPIMMVLLIASHLYVALTLKALPPHWQLPIAFVAAALFGGFCAFGFQALDHELMHTTSTPFATALGFAGSSCTAVPWFSYYFSGGHAMHHRRAGLPKDVDREAFFWAWEKTPAWLDSPFGSVIWASVVGLGLPILYMVSLSTSLLASWRQNITEVSYFLAESASTIALHAWIGYHGGMVALQYLVLSMAFGNGFLLHPLIAFWILQHACHSQSVGEGSMTLQPTISYNGSPFWNLLNFNQLSHVEHHDFSRIPWTRLPTLARMAPTFYSSSGMYTCNSIVHLIYTWVMTRGHKFHFGCTFEPVPTGTSK